jgi:carbonic anhydrase/acetyltransferase-like protein (isoleucine patch superfamily)
VPVSETKFPKLLASDWIAPNCTIIGDVTAGKYSSFYHGVSLRGDTCKITIGSKTVIQDNTLVINTDSDNPNAEVVIGDRVLIGVNCSLDSCRIDDKAVISNGATIHKGCHIEAGAMVAAGAVLPPNTLVPSGQIFAGNPAKYLRDLKPEETIAIAENNTELRELATIMEEHTEKSHYEFLNDLATKKLIENLSPEEMYLNSMKQFTFYSDAREGDDFGVEYGNAQDGLDEYEQEGLMRWTMGKGFKKENFDLYYEMDMTNYPDAFKVYGENYEKYDNLRRKYENEVPGESPGWPDATEPPKRPGAMRAWVSKWDPDYNIHFKQVGNQTENRGG